MLNYLHDIRNKLAVVTAHTSRLHRKYNDEEFMMIKTNLIRINDLINEAYQNSIEKKQDELQCVSVMDFVNQLDLLIEALALSYAVEFKNQIAKAVIQDAKNVNMNIHLLSQALENAIDNAIKANSSKIYIQLYEADRMITIEMIDNGNGITTERKPVQDQSCIPHGMGKQIIQENMRKMGGTAQWVPRMDSSGMIVRLSLPSTIAPSV